MIDLDRIEASCDALIKQGFGWNNPACTSASTVKEIITLLRQAEKDAARYRFLKSSAPMCKRLLYYQDEIRGKYWDDDIDSDIDAMQCK